MTDDDDEPGLIMSRTTRETWRKFDKSDCFWAGIAAAFFVAFPAAFLTLIAPTVVVLTCAGVVVGFCAGLAAASEWRRAAEKVQEDVEARGRREAWMRDE